MGKQTLFRVILKNNKPYIRMEYNLGKDHIVEEKMIYGIKSGKPYFNYATPITERIPIDDEPELMAQLNELLAKGVSA